MAPVLSNDPDMLATMKRDFGGLMEGTPFGVYHPKSVEDLVEIVRHARDRGTRLTVRAAGQSQSGQSLARRSEVIDTSLLCGVGPLDVQRRIISCDAGTTWRQVVAETLPHGLIPPVVPLNLDLTVGGTLSAGGLGSSSHRKGFAASHVRSAKVVLGAGDVVECGPTHNRDVFDVILGGVGRVGVLHSTELRLEETASRTTTHVMLYDDLEVLIEDLLWLSSSGVFEHVEAYCSSSILGSARNVNGQRGPLRHWMYSLHATGTSEDQAAFSKLRFRARVHEEENDALDFAKRYDGRVVALKKSAANGDIHPWFEVILPASGASSIVRLAQRLPMFFGDGFRIGAISDGELPLAIAVPSSRPMLALAVLPAGIPVSLRGEALGALSVLESQAIAAGGKRYLSGFLFDMTEERWRAHYGPHFEQIATLMRTLDPSSVFVSQLTSPSL